MKFLIALLTLVFTCPLLAVDITVQLTGSITASTCVVDAASQNKTVEMGEALTADYPDINDRGPWVPFTLDIKNCPESVTMVNATFNGETDPNGLNTFLNSGTGEGLGLQVKNDKTSIYIMPNSSPLIEMVDPLEHSATYELSARYLRTSQTMKAGTFLSTLLVTFTYQ
ncbi:fimbrial protein [Franconibacter helveticus 513]|uniref:fimbrial protein n=1 Tax=Franconibacter helveticus TaxID=357240 RepID=UPI0003F60A4F|nr:fimbrial protein [Franconibacter helveticus]